MFQAFHFVTIEHYYIGELVLGPINGISDGCIGVMFASAYTMYAGNNFWATPICDGRWMGLNGVEDLTLGQCTALMISAGVTCLTLKSMAKVIMTNWYPRAHWFPLQD